MRKTLLVPSRGGDVSQPLLPGASFVGLGLGVGCGLVFSVAFGFYCSAFAVVSLALFVGAALVLVAPRGGGFVCP